MKPKSRFALLAAIIALNLSATPCHAEYTDEEGLPSEECTQGQWEGKVSIEYEHFRDDSMGLRQPNSKELEISSGESFQQLAPQIELDQDDAYLEAESGTKTAIYKKRSYRHSKSKSEKRTSHTGSINSTVSVGTSSKTESYSYTSRKIETSGRLELDRSKREITFRDTVFSKDEDIGHQPEENHMQTIITVTCERDGNRKQY